MGGEGASDTGPLEDVDVLSKLPAMTHIRIKLETCCTATYLSSTANGAAAEGPDPDDPPVVAERGRELPKADPGRPGAHVIGASSRGRACIGITARRPWHITVSSCARQGGNERGLG